MLRIELPLNTTQPILGVGAMYKNTLCLIKDNQAYISDVIGTLDTATAIEAYDKVADELLKLANNPVACAACDLHPDFHSTRFAESLKTRLFPVQHHHAHIAAVMAEHGMNQPILGVAFDGFGLGANNQSWGGELLLVEARGYRRLGRLRPLPQPGGDRAARLPWRMGAAALWEIGRGSEIAGRYAIFPQAQSLASLLERQLNCPTTSSAGRLFDAACGLLNVKPIAAFEGEAPMALEAMARTPEIMSEGWTISETHGLLELDLRPLLARIADAPPEEGANLFHGTLVEATAAWIEHAAGKTGLRRVAFGGGCFMNKLLREGLARRMDDGRITALWAHVMSPGDASISLGQAYAAAWAMEQGL